MIYTNFPKTEGKRALVLISGGMDSRVCLQKAIHDLGPKHVVAVSVYYGQKHSKELELARKTIKMLGVEYHEIDLSATFSFSNSCTLLKSSVQDIEDTTYENQMKKKLENGEALVSSQMVPFRNGLFISYATALALQFNCSYVVLGAHSDDSNVKFTDSEGKEQKACAYPDCSKNFLEAMGKAVYEGTGEVISLVAPIYNLTKSQVALLGTMLGMSHEDFKNTWSCYRGGEKECLHCPTCYDKLKALRSIGFTDTELSEIFNATSEEISKLK